MQFSARHYDTAYESLQSYVQSDLLAAQAHARIAPPPAAGKPSKGTSPGMPFAMPGNFAAEQAAFGAYPSITSPRAPSAYPREHQSYTTGKASPATSWEPTTELSTDSLSEYRIRGTRTFGA